MTNLLLNIDAGTIDWSRAQFALTAIYHWLFVPLTLGLAVIMGIAETCYYRTGKQFWKDTAKFWQKLFGVNFAMGVATGIILEFEFGTNWSNYSWFVGDIFGAPLAIEGIVAFFMESTFVAVMYFGWEKVSRGFHLASTWLTWIGATISAWWILVANLVSRFFIRYQHDTATTKTAPIIQADMTVWQNLSMAKGERATSRNDTISLRMVSGLNSQPTGYCIQALATRIHQAEMVAPKPVSQVEAKWKPGDTFFHPKYITATKVDSIKKATIPSIANGAPKMSPTNHE